MAVRRRPSQLRALGRVTQRGDCSQPEQPHRACREASARQRAPSAEALHGEKPVPRGDRRRAPTGHAGRPAGSATRANLEQQPGSAYPTVGQRCPPGDGHRITEPGLEPRDIRRRNASASATNHDGGGVCLNHRSCAGETVQAREASVRPGRLSHRGPGSRSEETWRAARDATPWGRPPGPELPRPQGTDRSS